jgi:hypothetical protein
LADFRIFRALPHLGLSGKLVNARYIIYTAISHRECPKRGMSITTND